MDLAIICWRDLAWAAAVVILAFELHGATAQTHKGRRTSNLCLESLQDTYQPEDQLHEAWNDVKAYGRRAFNVRILWLSLDFLISLGGSAP